VIEITSFLLIAHLRPAPRHLLPLAGEGARRADVGVGATRIRSGRPLARQAPAA